MNLSTQRIVVTSVSITGALLSLGTLVAGSVLLCAAYGLSGVTQHAIVAIDHGDDVAIRVSGKHGTIAMADEDLGAIKSLIVHADLVARHEQQQLTTYDGYAARMVGDVDRVSKSIAGTADASAETARSASRAINTANDTIGSVRPVVSHLDSTVNGVNDQMPFLHRIIESSATTSEQFAGSSVSVNKMLATAEKKVDAKPTIKSRILEYGGPLIKILAWFAK